MDLGKTTHCCGFPLLATKVLDDIELLEVSWIPGQGFEYQFLIKKSHMEYRSAQAGDLSPVLTHCPQCEQSLEEDFTSPRLNRHI